AARGDQAGSSGRQVGEVQDHAAVRRDGAEQALADQRPALSRCAMEPACRRGADDPAPRSAGSYLTQRVPFRNESKSLYSIPTASVSDNLRMPQFVIDRFLDSSFARP